MRRPVAYMHIAGALRELDADPEVVEDILRTLPSDDGLVREALTDPAKTIEAFEGLRWRESVFMDKGEPGICPTCGDPLEPGAKCSRCDWGVPSPNAMTDGEEIVDPTRDMHRGIQSKWGAFEDPYMYHVAPKQYRNQIEAQGIKASDPWQGQWGHEELVRDQAPGAYLFHNWDHAHHWAYENMGPDSYDMWMVDPSGLQLQEDPKMSYPSSYSSTDIPPNVIGREIPMEEEEGWDAP
jgi:hypothetical protein